MSIDKSRLRETLATVLRSKSLGSSPQLVAFLEFVVEETIQGNADRLKAYTIATSALGRPKSFDPQTDPIVRVQARRLRLTLDQYYLREGPNDEIRIELVPGSYVPNFILDGQTLGGFDAKDDNLAFVPVQLPVNSSRVFTPVGAESRTAASPNKLLVLDDEPDIRLLVRKIGESAGFTVLDTANANEFWVAYRALQPTLIVLDLVIPGMDGVEILRELAQQKADCRIVLISGLDTKVLTTTERLGKAIGVDIIGALSKPFDIDEFGAIIQPSTDAGGPITADQLSNAIERGELTVHYQPKIELVDGSWSRVVGFEGLARWHCPARGFIPPMEFIPLAEQAGLIGPLTREIIRIGIKQLAQWTVSRPDLSLAINLSAHLLTDVSLPDQLAQMVDAENIVPSRLVIEITEAAAFDSKSEIADTLARFRLKGFQLSIDDFGTGYSSLLGLFTLPFNELKIDRSFVSELTTNNEARVIVAAVIGLAKNLNLKTCAEGVETLECGEMLAELGCDTVQGYLYSKPVPASELDGIIAAYHELSGSKLASIA